MAKRIAIALVGLLIVASTASAQKVEVSVSGGYTASDGVTSNQQPRLGQLYDEALVDSGSAFNFTAGMFVTPQLEVEFLFARQGSKLQAAGSGVADLPISELTIYNYHGNLVYNWGEMDARVRPFVFGGLGATQYSFGDVIAAQPVNGRIPSETRFSSTWGGGVKFYFSPKVGARAALRWTPTYIKSDPAGVWCDPFYGCFALGDAQYSNQFETSFGITVRFD